MVCAYLMWKRDINFDAAFALVKECRGVASPNAGFICRLLALQKDLHPTGPPDPPRLFRLTPFVGGPVARSVDATPHSSAQLDARMCAVLYGPKGLFVWIGEKSHSEYLDGARQWAAQLVKFEKAPKPIELKQGDETSDFWDMLGGEGPVASRVPEYDKDYGVGTVPTIPLPEVEVSMPSISAPMSLVGGGGVPETPRLIPGIHTTAEDDALLPSARGPRPPMGGLSLAGLSSAAPAAEPPPPTPRSFADVPRVADPMPTPRGAPPARPQIPGLSAASAPPTVRESESPAVPPLSAPRSRSSPDEAARERSSKKARDEGEEGEDEGDGGGGKAELYMAPDGSGSAEWSNLSMFDSEDLDENGCFLLLVYDAAGKASAAHFWVGSESPLSYERDSDIVEVGHEFLGTMGHSALPITLVFQGDEEEAFWEHFVNG